jgi:hypothetical protein
VQSFLNTSFKAYKLYIPWIIVRKSPKLRDEWDPISICKVARNLKWYKLASFRGAQQSVKDTLFVYSSFVLFVFIYDCGTSYLHLAFS